MPNHPQPTTLYKYLRFDDKILNSLAQNLVRYTDPKKFNDPIDCDPSIEVDSDKNSLEDLCALMLQELGKPYRITIARGNIIPVGTAHDHEYQVYKSDFKPHGPPALDYYTWSLAKVIKECLMKIMRHYGVLSLARDWNCPLMWSHYADQHQGICVAYNIETTAPGKDDLMRKVEYNRPPSVKTSDLFRWITDKTQENEISLVVPLFFVKAPHWAYENEWRTIRWVTDDHIPDSSPRVTQFQGTIKEILFGVRCPPEVQAKIVVEMKSKGVSFYKVRRVENSFELKRGIFATE